MRFLTLLKNEIKLSLRGMDMIIFAIGMPIMILIILGAIYGNKPAFEGAEYTFLQQSFSALISISICAGGLMGLPLVVSDYRNKKILKRFKVTPVSPIYILLVQVSIYLIYSLVSFALLFIIAKVFFDYSFNGNLINFILAYILVIVSIFSIGMMVGGLSKNIKVAGMIASLLYFPSLIFSGTTVPYEVMPHFLKKIANLLPLTQGINLLKSTSLNLHSTTNSTVTSIIVMIVIAVVSIFISIKFFKWE